MARVVLVVALVVLAAVAAAQGWSGDAALAAVQSRLAELRAWREASPAIAAATYFVVYTVAAGVSLPGAAVMTLVGGALFGLVAGTLLVSFASSAGATIAFLLARWALRDPVERWLGGRAVAVRAGFDAEGPWYLLSLRLVPLVPFVVVNLAMGLTRMPVATFYGVSQLGMLPATVVYVAAGSQLGALGSVRDVLSPGVLAALATFGLLPLAARGFVHLLRRRAIYRPWAHLRPRRFDSNVVVIGGGAAGLVAAAVAAATKAAVTLVERDRMGGDCLHAGCVPSKTLLRTARLAADIRRAPALGVRDASVTIDFAAVMARVQAVITQIAPHDSVERFTSLGVDCVIGDARITSPWTVEIAAADGTRRTVTTRAIVVAAGARPVVPPIPGLADCRPLTTDTVWDLRVRPTRLLVLGGGPAGCELAQAFARLGTAVTLVEQGPRLLPREDADVSALVVARFTSDGIDVRTSHRAVRVDREGSAWRLTVDHDGVTEALVFDEMLCATGRAPNVAGYGLETLGLAADGQGLPVDRLMATRIPNVFACGDVTGGPQFTHAAARGARHAAINALLGRWWRVPLDDRVMPWATFTDPEVARVGLNEQEARARQVPYALTVCDLARLDRAVTDGDDRGFVKVLTAPGTDRILGVTIVGPAASEAIGEFVTAMTHGLGLERLLRTVHVYPTVGELTTLVATAWKRSTVTRGQMDALSAFHAWRRGDGSAGAVLAALPGLVRVRPPDAHRAPTPRDSDRSA